MKDIVFPIWLTPLEKLGRIAQFSAGTVIFPQGDTLTEVGLVLQGKARATAFSKHGDETWLCEFNPGSLVGHLELLNDEPLLHELSADTEMLIFFVPATLMLERIHADLATGNAIAGDLARRLKVMMDRYIEALTLSAKGRVCAELYRLANPIGVKPEHMIVRPNPVFVELAVRINSTRETVSRAVSELQKKGVLVRETGALIVQNPAALKSAIK